LRLGRIAAGLDGFVTKAGKQVGGRVATMIAAEKSTGMCELLAALDGTIAAADPGKRAAVAAMMDAYARDFAAEYRWAAGPQAPTLLSRLLATIDTACRPECHARRDGPYVIDRKSYPQPYEFAPRRPEPVVGAAHGASLGDMCSGKADMPASP
jgi:hypothetical protein